MTEQARMRALRDRNGNATMWAVLEMNRRRDAGEHGLKIAADMGFHSNTIYYHTRRRKRRCLTPEEIAAMRELRAQGLSLAKIAYRFKIGKERARRLTQDVVSKPPKPDPLQRAARRERDAEVRRLRVDPGLSLKALRLRFGLSEVMVREICADLPMLRHRRQKDGRRRAAVAQLLAQGHSIRVIARKVGCSRWLVSVVGAEMRAQATYLPEAA